MLKVLEVRCCCNPGKLLGHISLPEILAKGPGEVRVTMRSERYGLAIGEKPQFLTLELAWVSLPPFAFNPQTMKTEALRPHERRYLAIKDNGATLDQLRRCAYFTEAKS